MRPRAATRRPTGRATPRGSAPQAGVAKTANITFNGYMQGVQFTPVVSAYLMDLAKNGRSAAGLSGRHGVHVEPEPGLRRPAARAGGEQLRHDPQRPVDDRAVRLRTATASARPRCALRTARCCRSATSKKRHLRWQQRSSAWPAATAGPSTTPAARPSAPRTSTATATAVPEPLQERDRAVHLGREARHARAQHVEPARWRSCLGFAPTRSQAMARWCSVLPTSSMPTPGSRKARPST